MGEPINELCVMQKTNDMKNYLNKILFLTILTCIVIIKANGQIEFLVTVNPSNSALNIVDSLPGVKWVQIDPGYTAFDENNHNYIFKGADQYWNNYLYTVNANTGNIIYNPPFPVLTDTSDNVLELQFDNSSNILYGLHWDNSEGREYFVSVNQVSGTYTIIDSLPGVKWVMSNPNYTVFDKIHHHYIFRGADVNMNSYLYTVDALTGAILSNPSFPVLANQFDNIEELQFDNSTNTLYGLHFDSSDGKEYLATINPNTGLFTKIDSLPGVVIVRTNKHYTTFNEINHRFIFKGVDNNQISHIYSIDANTGSIISSPTFPVSLNPDNNIIEFQYDNFCGILYALKWDVFFNTENVNNESTNKFYHVFPNPFSFDSKVILDKTYNKIEVIVYDLLGQAIKNKLEYNSSIITVERDNLPSGVYFISVFCNGHDFGIKKIIIE
jgi:hypothetical protein